MKTAFDLMTPDPIWIPHDMPLSQAVHFFLKNQITSVPVIGPLGEIYGQISDLNLLRAYVKSQANPAHRPVVGEFEKFLDRPRLVDRDAGLGEVLRAMQEPGTHRVLVVDQAQRILGIISPKDLLRVLTGESRNSNKIQQDLKMVKDRVTHMRDDIKGLQNQMQHFEDVLKTGLYLIHSVDAHGKILMANAQLHEVLGYGEGELIGKSLYDLYPSELHQTVKEGLVKIMLHGGTEQVVSTLKGKSGGLVKVEMASAAMKDEKGDFIGTFTISHQIDSAALLNALSQLMKDKT